MVTAPEHISSTTRCLREINSRSIDFDQPLFAHYPAMKMGVGSAVDAYISAMAELAKDAMSAHPEYREWVITAPPYQTLPAAANLLCWKLKTALESDLADDRELILLDLHYLNARTCAQSERDFRLRYDYSKNSPEERAEERKRLRDDIVLHGAILGGRGVLVVNDIKVTGIQQQHMAGSFAQVKPAHIEWLYIFVVNPALGATCPEIEQQVNSSRLQSVQEYGQIICADDTHHTARCISRLFSYSLENFKTLVDSLEPAKRCHLIELIKAEHRFDGEYFAEKIELLESNNF